MKYTLILPCLGLLSLAAANAQTTTKPGTVAPAVLQATLVNQDANKDAAASGGVRRTYVTVTTRYGNREILADMVKAHAADATVDPAIPATAALLDGTVSGWSIVRLADKDGNGKLYAIKSGKAAVAVPTYLLTQPVVTGSATTGTEFFPASTNTTGVATYSVVQKAYGTATVTNGSATVSGTQTVKNASIKINGTTTQLQARTQDFTIIGQKQKKTGATTTSGTVNAGFRITRATPSNLITLLPGSATP